MELESLNNKETPEGDSDSSSLDVQEKKIHRKDRGSWGNRAEFLLAIIGFTVGVGSIWRFPILCARNGGGAFIIPFLFFMITCGWPLYYIEVCLGQFTGQSPGAAFEFCPLFKGIGFLMVSLSFNILWYYVSIMGWVQYYFVQSFFDPLPWTTCNNWWNTKYCREYTYYKKSESDQHVTSYNTSINSLLNHDNQTYINLDTTSNIAFINSSIWTSSAEEFWKHNVLRQSDGLENMGTLQLHLVLANFIAWLIVIAALIKGVKSLGKVVYITATAPYILLTILLIRGLTLDGAVDGIIWYLTPDFEKLASPQVWQQAAVQVFYSLGPTYGGAITMASHNKFHQKSILETTVCVAADAFTALYAGLVVFTCLGFIAYEAGTTVEEVAKSASGPGLAFIAYPEAINRLPLPQLWAVLFFFTLIVVAFDSAFGFLETVTDTLLDLYSKQLRKYEYLVRFGTGFLLFMLGLPLCMNTMTVMCNNYSNVCKTKILYMNTRESAESSTETIVVYMNIYLQWTLLEIGLTRPIKLPNIETRSCIDVGGIYLFELADWYILTYALLFGSALESFMVCWIYGADRFSRDIELMMGRPVPKLIRLCWCIIMTGFLTITFFIILFTYDSPNYGGSYTYKPYAIAIGILMALIPFLPVFGMMFWQLYHTEGTIIQRIKFLLQPSSSWQPVDEKAKDVYRTNPYEFEGSLWQRIRLNLIGDAETPWI
ncbi:hypothetical protein ACF0H5_001175 [Mactra antiquata]